MNIYEETHFSVIEEVCLKIKNLYLWLDIGEEDREKYNSFNIEQLNELCSILQKHKEYREKEIKDRKMKKMQ